MRENGRLLAMMAELSGFVRHEMRNPLSGILAGLQVFQAEKIGGDDAQEIFRLLIDEVKSADALLDRLVGETTFVVSELERHQLGQLITRVAEGSSMAARKADSTIVVIPGPPDAAVTVDEKAMERALSNVAAYCLHASEPQRSFRIGWRDVTKDEAASLFPGFTGVIVNIYMEVTAKHSDEEMTDTSLLTLFRKSPSKWDTLAAAVAGQIVDIHGGILKLGNLLRGGTVAEVFLPGEWPVVCGEARVCPGEDGHGASSSCAPHAQDPAGENGPCWFSFGLSRRVQTGEWPDMCLKCPEFRSHNLSLYQR